MSKKQNNRTTERRVLAWPDGRLWIHGLPPKVEKGKQTQVTVLGNKRPSTTPVAADAKAHQPRTENETGVLPSIMRPSKPIQKPPIAPMIAPPMRSLRVAGARYQVRNRAGMGAELRRGFVEVLGREA